MEMHEYLDTLSEQIRCKKARPMVVEEIENHINDQAEAYIKDGMEKDAAWDKAVTEMGDPVEAGVALDRVHRPRMQWELVILVALLSLAGLVIQIVIFKTGCLSNDSNVTTVRDDFIVNAVLNTLIGLAVIAVVCALDYSFLGKHPVAVWWTGCICLLVCHFVQNSLPYSLRFTLGYYIVTFMTPMFAAVVFCYRGKGMKGLLKCILLYALAILTAVRASLTAGGVVELSIAALFILTIAILKGWFGEKKAGRLALIWIPAVILPGTLTASAFRTEGGALLNDYQAARIRAIVTQSEESYYIKTIKEEMDHVSLLGNKELPLESLPAIQNDYVVTSMLTYFGVIFTVAVLAIAAYFLWKAFRLSFKQKNQLGSMISLGCVCLLFVKSMLYLLSNIAVFNVFAQMSMPFLSYGLGNAVVNGVLVGLLLSVYRNTDIVSEKRIRSRYVFRSPIQKI